MKRLKRLSVIIPCYNEEKSIKEIIRRVIKAKVLGLKKQIIVVNDGSTDATFKKLKTLNHKNLIIINKKKNQGKGAAIKDALKKVAGDVVVIQDADLEYNPNEYPLLLTPILEDKADVVYGSRFVTTKPRRVLYFWHNVGNNLITTLSNIFTNLNLTDIETCYKMFTYEVAKKLNLKENRFGFEPEFTAKVAKMGCRIYEVGISYSGRTYEEGKKIKGIDGLLAIWYILKFNLFS